MNDILLYLDKLNSINNITYYPYDLNNNLIDNIIETKKEIELEYSKNYIFNDSKKIKGSSEKNNIFIF